MKPVVLVCKKGAASSEAALNFVQDQKGSRAAAGGLDRGQELRISGAVTAFALDGLHQYGRGLGANGLQPSKVIVRNNYVARNQGAVGAFVFLASHGAQGSGRGAVVGVFKRYDFRALGNAFGQLQRSLNGFGPRIGEVNAV